MKKLLVLLAGTALIFIAATGSASAECDLCGDVNGDGFVDIDDVVALINWMFPPEWPPVTPECPNAGDVNCDTGVTTADIDYLMDYIFSSGPPPCDTDDDGNPECDYYP